MLMPTHSFTDATHTVSHDMQALRAEARSETAGRARKSLENLVTEQASRDGGAGEGT